MKTYKSVLAIIGFALSISSSVIAQPGETSAWVDPSPGNVTDSVRLYIDLSHPDCGCPLLQDYATPNAPVPIYMWTWVPAESGRPAEFANGAWNASNPNLAMRQDPDNPAYWYYTMIPTSFYNVPAATVYETGFSFLAKAQDGSAIEGGEPKSADQANIPIEPLECVDVVCPFPQVGFQDEYFFIVYDTNRESGPMANVGPDNCYMFLRYSVNGGANVTYNAGSLQNVAQTNPELKMNFDGDGVFSFSMLPEEFLNLNEGDELTSITVQFVQQPFAGFFSQPSTLLFGCP